MDEEDRDTWLEYFERVPKVCELCGEHNPTKCEDLKCNLDPAIDGKPGKGCTYFTRWIRVHCYNCGRHYTETEIILIEAEEVLWR